MNKQQLKQLIKECIQESETKLNENWKGKLRDQYASFEEFKSYNNIYNLANRLGFKSVEEAWRVNPTISGSVNPTDYKRIKENGDEFSKVGQHQPKPVSAGLEDKKVYATETSVNSLKELAADGIQEAIKKLRRPVDIGDGFYIIATGMDLNGNFAVWVSKGASRAKKIQTNGNIPAAHQKKAEEIAVDEKAKAEIKDYYNKYFYKRPQKFTTTPGEEMDETYTYQDEMDDRAEIDRLAKFEPDDVQECECCGKVGGKHDKDCERVD
jgi:hypothetical protein